MFYSEIDTFSVVIVNSKNWAKVTKPSSLLKERQEVILVSKVGYNISKIYDANSNFCKLQTYNDNSYYPLYNH